MYSICAGLIAAGTCRRGCLASFSAFQVEPLKSRLTLEISDSVLTYEQAVRVLSTKLKKLDIHSYYHSNWKPDVSIAKMASDAIELRKQEKLRQRAKSLHPEFAKAM